MRIAICTVCAVWLLAMVASAESKIAEERYDNGGLKSRGEMVKDSTGTWQKQGQWIEWFENGKMKSLYTYNNARRNGKCAEWSDQGCIMWEGHYRDGVRWGEWIEYFADGTVRARGLYSKDRKVGVWTHYNEKGQEVEKLAHYEEHSSRVE